jgi:hypothetical protein
VEAYTGLPPLLPESDTLPVPLKLPVAVSLSVAVTLSEPPSW